MPDSQLDPLEGLSIIVDGETFESSDDFYARFFPQIADSVGKVVIVDGKQVDMNDLTFKEQRNVRKYVRDLTGEADLTVEEASTMDLVPAVVAVVKQRENPSYTVEDALEIPESEVWRKPPAKNGTGPTKAKATRSTAGRTGTRATS